MAKIRIKNVGRPIAWLMRGICASLRYEIVDEAGAFDHGRPLWIWAFWHNRMFVFPYLHSHWYPHRRGAVLTSPSGDGQIIADVCAGFGFEAVRGSSSKPLKGLAALIAMAGKLRAGLEIGITPDGPRGPRYQLQPGIIKLGQLTGAPIIPVRVEYSHALRFKTWDQFMLPMPFSRARIILQATHTIPRKMTEAEFEEQRLRLQAALGEG